MPGAPTAVAAALTAAMLFRSATAAEELRVTNAENVHGNWRITEVELYADIGCSVRLSVDTNSAFAWPLPTGKVWRHDIMNPGQDCYGKCREGSAGFCDFCGLGNACCRAGDRDDPPECQYAVGFTGAEHECVAVAPHGPITQESVQDAFDGKPSTAFSAACPAPSGCIAGDLVVGASLVDEAASVRCAVVVLPSADLPAVGPVEQGKRLQFWRRRSPPAVAPGCPGICRSGRYLEGHNFGTCSEHLSQHGWCGTSPSHASGGTDCRGCLGPVQSWEALNLQLVRLESRANGELRAMRMVAVGAAPLAPRAFVREPLRRDEAPPPLMHAGEDCWGMCGRSKSGYCASFCGLGNACCRKGHDADPSECRTAYGFTGIPQHECVRTRLRHEGEDCWGACDGKSGYCDWCGLGNACCKKGFRDDPEECRAAIFTAASYHHCVRLSKHGLTGASLRGSSAQVPRPRDAENATAAQPQGVSLSMSVSDERPSIEEDVLVVRLWISVCLLSAALGAAIGAACLLLYLRPLHRQTTPQRQDLPALAPASGGACLLLQQRRLALSCGDSIYQSSGDRDGGFHGKKMKAIEWVE